MKKKPENALEERKIVECRGCGYRKFISIDMEECKYCDGKLEVIAREIL
ncbi:hypothetical protein LCGC14_2392420 [marine sediment metagenome]|uniref:Uncharacterized protein n=1 Tax=marine sediment metagenome TaxID=412755 RepID=A0A0F9CJX6_9ZZZZ